MKKTYEELTDDQLLEKFHEIALNNDYDDKFLYNRLKCMYDNADSYKKLEIAEKIEEEYNHLDAKLRMDFLKIEDEYILRAYEAISREPFNSKWEEVLVKIRNRAPKAKYKDILDKYLSKIEDEFSFKLESCRNISDFCDILSRFKKHIDIECGYRKFFSNILFHCEKDVFNQFCVDIKNDKEISEKYNNFIRNKSDCFSKLVHCDQACKIEKVINKINASNISNQLNSIKADLIKKLYQIYINEIKMASDERICMNSFKRGINSGYFTDIQKMVDMYNAKMYDFYEKNHKNIRNIDGCKIILYNLVNDEYLENKDSYISVLNVRLKQLYVKEIETIDDFSKYNEIYKRIIKDNIIEDNSELLYLLSKKKEILYKQIIYDIKEINDFEIIKDKIINDSEIILKDELLYHLGKKKEKICLKLINNTKDIETFEKIIKQIQNDSLIRSKDELIKQCENKINAIKNKEKINEMIACINQMQDLSEYKIMEARVNELDNLKSEILPHLEYKRFCLYLDDEDNIEYNLNEIKKLFDLYDKKYFEKIRKKIDKELSNNNFYFPFICTKLYNKESQEYQTIIKQIENNIRNISFSSCIFYSIECSNFLYMIKYKEYRHYDKLYIEYLIDEYVNKESEVLNFLFLGCGNYHEIYVTLKYLIEKKMTNKKINITIIDKDKWKCNFEENVLKLKEKFDNLSINFMEKDFYHEIINNNEKYTKYDVVYFSRCVNSPEQKSTSYNILKSLKKIMDIFDNAIIGFSQIVNASNDNTYGTSIEYENKLYNILNNNHNVDVYNKDLKKMLVIYLYKEGLNYYLYVARKKSIMQ